MTQPITALANVYAGQTCYIVGKGPSLLNLTADHFAQPGPVVTLNQAICTVQTLGLPNPLLSMQKDGAYPIVCDRPCAHCPDTGPDMVRPDSGALLLVSKANSAHCFTDYRPRYVFDTEADLFLYWRMASAVVAVRLAELMSCTGLVFVSLDACTTGDVRTCVDGRSTVIQDSDLAHSYRDTAQRLDAMLFMSPIRDVTWLTP